MQVRASSWPNKAIIECKLQASTGLARALQHKTCVSYIQHWNETVNCCSKWRYYRCTSHENNRSQNDCL